MGIPIYWLFRIKDKKNHPDGFACIIYENLVSRLYFNKINPIVLRTSDLQESTKLEPHQIRQALKSLERNGIISLDYVFIKMEGTNVRHHEIRLLPKSLKYLAGINLVEEEVSNV